MKDRQVFLRHFAECLQRVREYTAEGREQFADDRSAVKHADNEPPQNDKTT